MGFVILSEVNNFAFSIAGFLNLKMIWNQLIAQKVMHQPGISPTNKLGPGLYKDEANFSKFGPGDQTLIFFRFGNAELLNLKWSRDGDLIQG